MLISFWAILKFCIAKKGGGYFEKAAVKEFIFLTDLPTKNVKKKKAKQSLCLSDILYYKTILDRFQGDFKVIIYSCE